MCSTTPWTMEPRLKLNAASCCIISNRHCMIHSSFLKPLGVCYMALFDKSCLAGQVRTKLPEVRGMTGRSLDNLGAKAIRKTWPSVSWRPCCTLLHLAAPCCTLLHLAAPVRSHLSSLEHIGTQFSIHILLIALYDE